MVEIKAPVNDVLSTQGAAAPRAKARERPAEDIRPDVEVSATRLLNEARQTTRQDGGDAAFDGDHVADRGRDSMRVFLFELYQRLGYSRSEATEKVEKMTGTAGFQLSKEVEASLRALATSPPAPAAVGVSLRVYELELDTREAPPPPSLSVHSLSGRLEFADDAGNLVRTQPVVLTADAGTGATPAPASGGAGLDAWRYQRADDAEVPAREALGALFGDDNVSQTATADVFVVRTDAVLAIGRLDVPRSAAAGTPAPGSGPSESADPPAPDDPDVNVTA